MARQTVDIASVGPRARGVGNVGNNAVTTQSNYDSSSADLLKNALGVSEEYSQARDVRKAKELDQRVEAEMGIYVTKALDGDNTTGMDELDTLFPDLTLTHKLAILENSGLQAVKQDETINQKIVDLVSSASTLADYTNGFAEIQQYAQDTYGETNSFFFGGVTNFITSKKNELTNNFSFQKAASQKASTLSAFQEADAAAVARGDFEGLQAQTELWKSHGSNHFYQGGERNKNIRDAAQTAAIQTGNVKLLSELPEEYRGPFKGNPAGWLDYTNKVQETINGNELQKLQDANTRKNLEEAAETDALSARVLESFRDPNKPLTEDEELLISQNPTVSAELSRMKASSQMDTDVSSTEVVRVSANIARLTTAEDFANAGLTDLTPDGILKFVKAQNIHPQHHDDLFANIQQAVFVAAPYQTDTYKDFKVNLADMLGPIKLEGMSQEAISAGSTNPIYTSLLNSADAQFRDRVAALVEAEKRQPTKGELIAIQEETMEATMRSMEVRKNIRDAASAGTPYAVSTQDALLKQSDSDIGFDSESGVNEQGYEYKTVSATEFDLNKADPTYVALMDGEGNIQYRKFDGLDEAQIASLRPVVEEEVEEETVVTEPTSERLEDTQFDGVSISLTDNQTALIQDKLAEVFQDNKLNPKRAEELVKDTIIELLELERKETKRGRSRTPAGLVLPAFDYDVTDGLFSNEADTPPEKALQELVQKFLSDNPDFIDNTPKRRNGRGQIVR